MDRIGELIGNQRGTDRTDGSVHADGFVWREAVDLAISRDAYEARHRAELAPMTIAIAGTCPL
jgi:hypothetical protein